VAQRAKNKPELKIVVSNTPEVPAVEPVPEQVEMPFAIVNGEPVTQMPKDLYIPPQAMEVFLEAFEGPLDLLLYLIRRQNLNILDIPLAEITRQYMKYIEVMTELQLELAGEYMVMAATLAEIKSRMLLPRPKVDPEGNEEDPRAELVRRLQEYERFKRAAESIDALPRLERDVWQTSAELKDRKVVRLLPTVTLQEMLLAFKDVVVRSEMFAHHHIQRERLSVRERMTNVMAMLEQASFVEFVRLFRVEEGRMGVTVTFMALLELVREGLVEIVQAEPFAPIHVRAAGASRKLHVVGGNEALAGEAVVLGEGDPGDVPAIGVLTTPADLASLTELVLDPNFVDDDDDDEEDAPLEGVDDIIAEPSPPPPVAEVALADTGSTPPAVEPTAVVDELTADIEESASVGAVVDLAPPPIAIEPVLATDVVAEAVESVLVAEPADVTFTPAADSTPSPGADGEPQLPADVVVASVEPVLNEAPTTVVHLAPGEGLAANFDLGELADAALEPMAVSDEVGTVVEPMPSAAVTFEPTTAAPEVGAAVELAPPPVAIEPQLPADVVVASVEPVLNEVSTTVAIEPVLASDVVAEAVESMLVAEPADVTFTPAVDIALPSATDSELQPETGAVAAPVEPVPPDVPTPVVHLAPSAAAAADVEPATDLAAVSLESALADVPVPVEAGAVVEWAPVHDPASADVPEPVVDLAATQVDVPTSAYELVSAPPADDLAAVDVPSPSIGEPTVSAGPASDEIAVTLEPSLTDVIVAAGEPSSSADVAPVADPSPAVDEPVVTVDPAVFDAPVVTAESEPPGGTLPEEEPTVDVEYEVSADELAAAEAAASDDDVSLVGDTSVVGDVSLVGEESVSGGPAVEVEEFAFDELPALDDAEHADQQPVAGAQTEESDD
jgi:segregation and condensation protein A